MANQKNGFYNAVVDAMQKTGFTEEEIKKAAVTIAVYFKKQLQAINCHPAL